MPKSKEYTKCEILKVSKLELQNKIISEIVKILYIFKRSIYQVFCRKDNFDQKLRCGQPCMTIVQTDHRIRK